MTGRRRLALAAIWLGPSLVFVAVTAHVMIGARLVAPPRLAAPARAALLAIARGALDGQPSSAARDPAILAPFDDTVAISLWSRGTRRARALGQGPTIAAATTAAAQALVAQPLVAALAPADRAAARLEIDVVTARAALGSDAPWVATVTVPAVSDELIAALALVPGQDGVGVRFDDGREALLLPGEVVDDNLVKREHAVGFVPDVAVGFDPALAARILTRGQRSPVAAWFRFRTDAFVEGPDHAPLALDRGLPPGPAPTAANLRAGALAGARYLVAHLAPSGRYVYTHDLVTGARSDPATGSYSIPRHAGVTYFLAQTYRLTHEAWLRAPIERAVGHLEQLVDAGGCTGDGPGGAYACVRDASEIKASLGSTALAIVALVEYERATGDPRYRPLALRLGRWVLAMQRADGSFAHYYDVATRTRDEAAMLPYFSGEAALALARLHAVTGDPIYGAAATRALDWLVDWYDFFLGGFFFAEEHWTCIAAEALDPALAKPAYAAFCADYGAFLRGQQLDAAPGDAGDDWAGAYSTAPFLVPSNTPTGSRTEAMISTYELGARTGQADPALARQIRASLAYLVRQQVAPDRDFAAAGLDVLGAVPNSAVDRTVRIDYVQHVGSAMIRAAELGDLVEPTQE
ncbi:MAG: hypothetical protein K8W52_02805 [Deltaproteobacteria bacterium]|nr:hypothetical protein [Deltaproteobacteria bacterium]